MDYSLLDTLSNTSICRCTNAFIATHQGIYTHNVLPQSIIHIKNICQKCCKETNSWLCHRAMYRCRCMKNNAGYKTVTLEIEINGSILKVRICLKHNKWYPC